MKNDLVEINDLKDLMSWLVEYHKQSLSRPGLYEAHDVIFELIRDLCHALGGDNDNG